MKLEIDTTDSKNIKVSLSDSKSKKTLTSTQARGSQVLLPSVVKLLKIKKAKIGDISEIKVNIGPGSFTGTRVGVAVANALGFALGAKVNGKKDNIVLPVYIKSKFD